MKKIVVAFLLVCFFSGCLKSGSSTDNTACNYDACAEVAPAAEIQAVKDYLSANSITAVQHCSGLFYAIDDTGSGTAPTICSVISFTYEGSLTNGNVFDQTTTPVSFFLSQLIGGFQSGIPLIKAGGKIRLYVPPSLGYGAKQVGIVPPNSILIYKIELVGVR